MMRLNKDFKKLAEMFLKIKTEEEMEDFLLGILTPKEREEIPMRLNIVKMIKSGLPQHEIAEMLGVGIATVTRGSRELKKGRFKAVN